MLKFLGRASFKLTTSSGLVIYIDPYAGTDYSEPADLVLISHGHSDHASIGKVKMKPDCVIITAPDAIPGSRSAKVITPGETLDFKDMKITATAAYNKNHDRHLTVGFLLKFDNLTLYHAGDTSKIPEMEQLAGKNIDYALFPVDGYYNMGPQEAMECAAVIKARHSIPMHSSPDRDYSDINTNAFNPAGVIRMKPGESINLK